MNRGERHEPIFQDDMDRRRFLQALGEACDKTDWQLQAYCLMGNHFHLVIETPNSNRVAGMKWLLSTRTHVANRLSTAISAPTNQTELTLCQK